MHKKLAADLTSLAHKILQMKNKDDVFALQQKAHALYEKLSVLAYVEEYINNTPNPLKSKIELISEIEIAENQRIKKNEINSIEDVGTPKEIRLEELVEIKEEEIVLEQITEEIEKQEVFEQDLFKSTHDESRQNDTELKIEKEGKDNEFQTISLEDELKDTISVDIVADLFEEAPKKSLNDKLHGDIQIGLNDRIAFVKNLFNGSQEDFNRVVSQLNTFKSHNEAIKFINKMIKPDYNWSEKEEFEERFMTIIERKFT